MDKKMGPITKNTFKAGEHLFFKMAKSGFSLQTIRLAVMAVMVAVFTVPALAWDGSQDLEPGLDAGTVLLFEDFERDGFDADWPTYWNSAPGPDTTASPVFAGSRALVLQGRTGEHYSENGGEYAPYTGAGEGIDKAHMRVYIYLQEGFTLGSCNQLKLFSIKAGANIEDTYGGAGTPPNGYNKMSMTFAIDTSMRLHFYTYHVDQGGPYGDVEYLDMGGIATLEPGRWVALEVMVQLNTPGVADGEIAAWVDGELRGEVKNLKFREVEDVRIRKFTVLSYFGGAGAQNTSPVDQKSFYDNVVIATEYIGLADGGDTGPPPGDGGDTDPPPGDGGDSDTTPPDDGGSDSVSGLLSNNGGSGCFLTLLP